MMPFDAASAAGQPAQAAAPAFTYPQARRVNLV
jgi:hypothetical protein